MSAQSCFRALKRSKPSYAPAAAFRVASLFMMLMISRPQRCTEGSNYVMDTSTQLIVAAVCPWKSH